ncbi:MAG TPA: MBL fold metallo-hydrolase, partial [Kofleriaceae bacterium]
MATALAACATPREPALHVQVPRAADDPDAITISWIGHATLLVGIHGHWILTDPVFSDRLGGVITRGVRAAITPGELPPLDAIVISHAHFDHLDLPSLRALPAVPLLVPHGIPAFLDDDLPQRATTTALDTWQSWQRGDLKITAVPASHGEGRYLVDRWHTRTHTGWIIEA